MELVFLELKNNLPKMQYLFMWLCISTLFSVITSEDSLEVTLDQGTLRGVSRKTWKGRSFKAFTGIPYAKPPIDDLRFKAPLSAGPWEGILDASKPHAICPQINILFHDYTVKGKEDCLYLNVYTPQLAHHKELLPVMFYIHGGCFTSGSGNSDLYGPDILLDKDIVLVVINYRLGALGFLSTGDEVAPGNNGLKDQNLALKWTRKNIDRFGGDPHRITLFGQSAGGASTHYHVLSPLSKDLIFGAIAHSGIALATWAFAPKEQALKNARKLAQFLNCPANSSKEMVDCFKKVDAHVIIEQDQKFMEWNYDPMIPFKPVVEPNIEGAFLAEDPLDIIKSGKFANIPFITGITADDGGIKAAGIYNYSTLVEELDSDFNRIVPIVLQYEDTAFDKDHVTKSIREFYFGNHSIDDSTKSEVASLFTDAWHLFPQNAVARLHARYSEQPVYYYLFGYHGSVSYGPYFGDPSHDYGVVHCDDLNYLLSCDLFLNYESAESEMIDVMTTLWTNFAKTGNPTPETNSLLSTKWKPVHSNNLEYYFIKNVSSITMADKLYFERAKFWKNLTIDSGKSKIGDLLLTVTSTTN